RAGGRTVEEGLDKTAGQAPQQRSGKPRIRPGSGAAAAVAEVPRRPAGTPRGSRRRSPAPLERLWAAYRRRPTDASRNRLVEAYQPLAREIVRRFGFRLPRSVDRGDLDTAANFGLISAIHGFDPLRGVRFESYCELRVKGALL